MPASVMPMVSVGEFSARGSRRTAHFAKPKSSTFTVPSGLILMFAGFQIAMHDALFVRRFEGVGDLRRDAEGFFERHRPLGDSPSTNSITR